MEIIRETIAASGRMLKGEVNCDYSLQPAREGADLSCRMPAKHWCWHLFCSEKARDNHVQNVGSGSNP